MGPILIFDKSTLQSLNMDESVWLDAFFISNITPIFFVETLADLSKRRTARAAPSLVAEIARKTPVESAFPNGFHLALAGNDMVGNHPPMTGQIVVTSGVTKRDPRGEVGTHFEQFDEADAMSRWQERKFEEIETLMAHAWRELLTNVDFRTMTGLAVAALGVERVKTLEDAKKCVDEYVQRSDVPVVRFARAFLGIGPQWEEEILQRYSRSGQQTLEQFAPYAAFVLKVSLFFHLAMASSLIEKARPSNMVDVSYLYYLPFCHVFASSDKLHARTAPLFCEQGQHFVRGADLKAALHELNEFYVRHMDEIERVGVIRFAKRPPPEFDNAVTRVWDEFAPGWREKAAQPEPEPPVDPQKRMTPELMQKIMEESVPIPEDRATESQYAMVRRRVPVRRGRWRLMPEGIENA